MVDELKLPWDAPPPVPTTLAEALLTELPPTDFNRNLGRLNAAKLDKPPPYRSFLGTPFGQGRGWFGGGDAFPPPVWGPPPPLSVSRPRASAWCTDGCADEKARWWEGVRDGRGLNTHHRARSGS
jgi:hypothetical protein